MAVFKLSAVLLTCVCLMMGHVLVQGKSTDDLVHHRRPRAVWQFSAMIKCVTGRPGLDFNNYGCWCGFGGGGSPVDDVDECCRLHDKCYDALVDDNTCYRWYLYTSSYRYDCDQATITCDANQGWFNTDCKAALCECDQEAALCFANEPYDDQYRHDNGFDTDSCLP